MAPSTQARRRIEFMPIYSFGGAPVQCFLLDLGKSLGGVKFSLNKSRFPGIFI